MPGAPSPHNRREQIDAATLTDLYVEQKCTVDRVAARLGVSPTTVRRRMRELGIPARPRGPIPRAPSDIAWSADLAWVVGLIATDGNLARNGRSICITSKDQELLETAQRCLGLRGGMVSVRGGHGRHCLRLQWKSRRLYGWLTTVGLMPAKTLRLGALAIPDQFFPDFLRGCIDGDGSIVAYVDRYNTRKHPKYVYDRLFVSLVSASLPFSNGSGTACGGCAAEVRSKGVEMREGGVPFHSATNETGVGAPGKGDTACGEAEH